MTLPFDGAVVEDLSPEPSAGALAVIAWSKRIHGKSDRHQWAVQCAVLLDTFGTAADLPDYPRAHYRGTAASRDETIRRVYLEGLTGGGPDH